MSRGYGRPIRATGDDISATSSGRFYWGGSGGGNPVKLFTVQNRTGSVLKVKASADADFDDADDWDYELADDDSLTLEIQVDAIWLYSVGGAAYGTSRDFSVVGYR